LQRYGFLVPVWGVLTSHAYRDFLHYNKLDDTINTSSSIRAEAVNDPANEKILEEIRRKINEGQIHGIIRQEMVENLFEMKLLDKPVVVRSSATAEDSSKGSFAGIHGSFLNVMGQEHIEQAIKECYSSLWTPRAVAYRRKMGFGDQDVALAVVIMEIGGHLSHGAIVAREYGIPAVVNVPGVMKTLKDGEQLTFDGDEGKVYRK
jgi:rifampicin phosphotransferase